LGAARRGGVHGAGAAARVWLARWRAGAKCVTMEGGGVAGAQKNCRPGAPVSCMGARGAFPLVAP
jgi:hypothetical protein